MAYCMYATQGYTQLTEWDGHPSRGNNVIVLNGAPEYQRVMPRFVALSGKTRPIDVAVDAELLR